ncbi:MAG TPA: hypothetical protein VFV59_09870 [Candidatus Limnocylindria bacterium]|nr:hypothetical protein [Candidatus Limnocylindria bacterium]
MDRDELQDRIRARRSGAEPYRRGVPAEDEELGYQRFEPEPEDTRARRPRQPETRREDHFREAAPPPPPTSIPAEPPSLTRERDEWEDRPIGAGPSVPPTVVPPAPTPTPVAPIPPMTAAEQPPYEQYEDPEYVDNFDDEAYEGEEYAYAEDWDDGRERRSGAGAFAILGFLALGVIALLGGALLAGIFGGDGGTGQVDTSPSATASAAVSSSAQASQSVMPSASASAGASASAPASGEPVVFPDGFTAEAQPCLPGSAQLDGCDSNASVNSGAVQIWVGFQNGTNQDVIGAALIGPEGNTLGTGSIDLADIDCGSNCGGYTYFNFSNLGPGTYQVEITRNGQHASSTSFEVS